MIILSSCRGDNNLKPSAEGLEKESESVAEESKGAYFSAQDADLSVRHASGNQGVVTTANPLVSKIGLEILKQGGNAVDAATAVSFALGLIEPAASGIGGCGYLLYLPQEGEPVFIDYRSSAPELFSPEQFMDMSEDERKNTVHGAGVPGAVDGWLSLWEMHGSMELDEILKPVIAIAETGYQVTPYMAKLLVDNYAKLSGDKALEELYINEGFPYSEGEIIKNESYARTLKLIAEQGRDVFYNGEIAQSIADVSSDKGAAISLDDLSGYKAIVAEPIKGIYRGYTVISSAPSSSGGTTIIEALNILENFDIASLGQNSAKTLHLMAESFKLSKTDSYKYVGDPKFNDIPLEILLSKEYAKERAALISEESVLTDIQEGVAGYESPSTTHFAIADKDNNVITVTNTLGTYFGCGTGVEGRGFSLDNQMFDFSVSDWEVNFPEAGKRPRSSMSPTIILDSEGRVLAALGSPGGEAIPTTLVQVIVNIIDFNMDIQEAIESPRIFQNYTGALVCEGNLGQDVIGELEEIGHIIEKRNSNDPFFGGVQAVLRKNGSWCGGADPRRDGKALAY